MHHPIEATPIRSIFRRLLVPGGLAACGVGAVLAAAAYLSACQGGAIRSKPDPLAVIEFSAFPAYRCPGEDLRLSWALNQEDGSSSYCWNRGVEMFVVVDQGSKVSFFKSEANSGEILIPAADVEAAFGASLPADIQLICQPLEVPGAACLSASEREQGQRSATVHTIYGDEWITQTGLASESGGDFFLVHFEPLVWSDALRTSAIRITEGCQGAAPFGTYLFDKGPETGSLDKELDDDNGHMAEFVHTPVQLIEDWLIRPGPDAGCTSRPGETIEVQFRVYCPTS